VIIELAGFNVDTETLNRLNKNNREILTPETFSAAYARISRSSKDIISLRQQARADVEKARKSNKAIIFEMGHHSVAEHAVFNFDIMGVSRLALEEIEKFRLVSYTEKSQRYVTLTGDYIIPKEINNQKDQKQYQNIINIQNQFYIKAYQVLKEYIFSKFAGLVEKKSNKYLLEGWAKEDARYILSLATEGQMGMTINARNLEHLLRRLALSSHHEVREIGKKIYSLLKNITPSILLFPEPSNFDRVIKRILKNNFSLLPEKIQPKKEPTIIHYPQDGDDMILASFLSVCYSMDYAKAMSMAKKMSQEKKMSVFKNLFSQMEFFDSPPREFEIPSITFQALTSAASFAQLKRHRIATILSTDLQPELGNTIPRSIIKTGLEKEFLEVITETNFIYEKLKKSIGQTAGYILTNSHRKMVIMKMNLRELYHFIRLRDDEHAQWDIKQLAKTILSEVKKVMPLATILLCGKSDFVNVYEKIYRSKPKQQI